MKKKIADLRDILNIIIKELDILRILKEINISLNKFKKLIKSSLKNWWYKINLVLLKEKK